MNRPFKIENITPLGDQNPQYRATLDSPITRGRLDELPDEVRSVQFFQPLSKSERSILSDWLSGRPHPELRVFGTMGISPATSLDFLEEFSFLEELEIDLIEIKSWDGLAHVSPKLKRLSLGQTRSSALSLKILERFPRLECLSLEGQKKHIEVVSALEGLKELRLRLITLPDLTLLLPLKKLSALTISLGGTRDVSRLPEIGKLKSIELALIRGLADLNSLGSTGTLESIRLHSLKHVTALASLKNLTKLRRVYLENLRGLADLRAVADAPALRELTVFNMPQLDAEDFRCFEKHRTLRSLRISLGAGLRGSPKDRAVRAMIPNTETPFTK